MQKLARIIHYSVRLSGSLRDRRQHSCARQHLHCSSKHIKHQPAKEDAVSEVRSDANRYQDYSCVTLPVFECISTYFESFEAMPEVLEATHAVKVVQLCWKEIQSQRQ